VNTNELKELQAKLMAYPTLDRDAWVIEAALKVIDEALKLRKAVWAVQVQTPSDQSPGYQTLKEALGGEL
jgi:hypothetical protein